MLVVIGGLLTVHWILRETTLVGDDPHAALGVFRRRIGDIDDYDDNS